MNPSLSQLVCLSVIKSITFTTAFTTTFITPSLHLHHTFITTSSHLHQTFITPSPHLHHIFITPSSQLHHSIITAFTTTFIIILHLLISRLLSFSACLEDILFFNIHSQNYLDNLQFYQRICCQKNFLLFCNVDLS